MILVTGASGKTGHALLRALNRSDRRTRALVRRAEQEGAVLAAGASDVVVCDLLDEAGLERAMSGIVAVYHICPNASPDEVPIGTAVLSAAARAPVERLVFHSVLHPQTERMPHHWRKLRVEESILESGVPFTILQPTAYMQNLLAQWDRITGEGTYVVPYSTSSRISLVDLDDVAEVAARVLTETGHLGATYELCGPDTLDQQEVAKTISSVLGKDVRAKRQSLEDWRGEARNAGLDDERAETLAAMFRYYDEFGLTGSPRVLTWLLGRTPTDLRAFLERTATSAG